MTDTVVYDTHRMNMNLEELAKAFDALPDYPQKNFDYQLAALIGEYANSKGVAFPGMGTLAARLHCFKMDVKRGVDRILKFGFFAVKKVKSTGAKWEHNVYVFAKRFLRKTVDKLAHHFDTAKWAHWVEEKMSARQRKKLIRRYCEQADSDLENAGVCNGWWMARRYVVKHVYETPEEYDEILAEAIGKYRDYEGPDYREIADRPVKPVQPVPVPVQETPVEPAPAPVSEKDMGKMFRVFDKHPELVDNPEKAARLAGVVLPDMKPASVPVSSDSADSVLQADTPIEWEDGSEWPTDPLDAPVVKQETNLETLPANTQPANTQPVQPGMTNCPKFINGEVSSLWESQQLLHELNPTMYPAY